MSVCYDIVCDDCLKAIWIGQGQIIYTGEKETMKLLTKFLYDHTGHKLRFIRDEDHEYEERI